MAGKATLRAMRGMLLDDFFFSPSRGGADIGRPTLSAGYGWRAIMTAERKRRRRRIAFTVAAVLAVLIVPVCVVLA